jgi:hypothetical protein
MSFFYKKRPNSKKVCYARMHGAGGAGAPNQVPDLVEDVGHQSSLIACALIESQ